MTTNRVAERAGVNIASLYQYFPNKQALVLELSRRHADATRRKSLSVLEEHSGNSLRDQLRAAVEAGIAAHRVSPRLHLVLEQELPAIRSLRKDSSVAEEATEVLAAIEDVIRQRVPEEAELASWIVRVTSHAVIHQALRERPGALDSGELAEELVTMLEAYLRTKLRRRKRATAPTRRR